MSLIFLQLRLTTPPAPVLVLFLSLLPIITTVAFLKRTSHGACLLFKGTTADGMKPMCFNGVKVTHFSRFLSLALSVLLFSVPRILCSFPSTLPPMGLPLPSLLQVSLAKGTTLCCMCAHRVCDPALRSSGDWKLLGDGDCIMFIYTPKAEPCACYIVDRRLFKGKAITLKC